MYLVKGAKTIQISRSDLQVTLFEKIYLDLGTGDGRFVYKNAKSHLKDLWIGIDPAETQLRIYSSKINKERLLNAYLILASAENVPTELEGIFDKIFVNYPWGSLLKLTVDPTTKFIESLLSLLKVGGRVQFLFGYNPLDEPNEVGRLNLPDINEDFLRDKLIPIYKDEGFISTQLKLLDKNKMQEYETSWSKKLGYGSSGRPIFLIEFKK